MKAQEIKNTIETIYKIQMAALKVYEAAEAMKAAKEAHEAVEFDYTFADKERNARYLSLYEDYIHQGGLVKRAVNSFFKEVGEEPKKWEYGFEAISDYNKYLQDHFLWGGHNPIPKFNIWDCCAREY